MIWTILILELYFINYISSESKIIVYIYILFSYYFIFVFYESNKQREGASYHGFMVCCQGLVVFSCTLPQKFNLIDPFVRSTRDFIFTSVWRLIVYLLVKCQLCCSFSSKFLLDQLHKGVFPCILLAFLSDFGKLRCASPVSEQDRASSQQSAMEDQTS